MIDLLRQRPYWGDKQQAFGHFTNSAEHAAWLDRRNSAGIMPPVAAELEHPGRINYGCGNTFLEGWLNVDLSPEERPGYACVNLLERHPFRSNSVQIAYSEDMIEHMTQAESIFVLSEMYRALAPGGILRLSFPCLEGVLEKHYLPAQVMVGEIEAYEIWDHIHFYSKEELRLVAKHVGFRDFKHVEYGQSEHLELRGRETRDTQIGLNLYVEMTK